MSGVGYFLVTVVDAPASYMSATLLIASLLWLIWLAVTSKVYSYINYNIIALFFVSLVLWPMLTLLYSVSDQAVLNIFRQLFLFVQLLVGVFYALTHSTASARRLLLIVYGFVYVGLLLSYFNPSIFTDALSATNSSIDYQGRAFGFQLQPNRAGEVLNILALMILSLGKYHNIRTLLFFVSWCFAIYITGSRGGMITGMSIFLYALISQPNTPLYRLSFGVRFFIVCLLLMLISTGFFLQSTLGSWKSDQIVSRYNSLTEDASVQSRIEALTITYTKAQDELILGHGLGSTEFYVKINELPKQSHNMFVYMVTDVGVIGLFFFLISLIYLRLESPHYLPNPSTALILFIFLDGLVSNTIYQSRELYTAIGLTIGFGISRKLVLQKNRLTYSKP